MDDQVVTFTHDVQHEIRNTHELPIHTKLYRYAFIHKEVHGQITEMLEDSIKRPSQSPWRNLICIVTKKGAGDKTKWRIVVDNQKLNEKRHRLQISYAEHSPSTTNKL